MNNPFAGFVAVLLALAVIAGLFIYSLFAYAYVVHTFWGWFILPNFTVVPSFTVMQFVAFLMIKQLLFGTVSYRSRIKAEYLEDSKGKELVYNLLGPWLLLALGGVIKFVLF